MTAETQMHFVKCASEGACSSSAEGASRQHQSVASDVRASWNDDAVPLPRATDYGLPEGTTVVVVVPSDGLTLYRLVDSDVPTVRDFEERRTRAQAERDGIPELFRLSVSHWLRHDQAAAHSIRRRFHVAELRLEPGTLVRLALTEDHGEGHVDVWANPQQLLDRVTNVVQGFRGA